MTQGDPASLICDALNADYLPGAFPGCEAVLHVEQDWRATDSAPRVLVADDGGGPLMHDILAEPLMRVVALATGRTQARAIAAGCADWLPKHRPAGIARLKHVSALSEGRDRDTGNYLVLFTVPAIVRPS